MDEVTDDIVEMFENSPVPHGCFFDDGRRWCAGCEHPRRMEPSIHESHWTSKTCNVCMAIWPEFADEFVTEMLGDDDFIDQFPTITIN